MVSSASPLQRLACGRVKKSYKADESYNFKRIQRKTSTTNLRARLHLSLFRMLKLITVLPKFFGTMFRVPFKFLIKDIF